MWGGVALLLEDEGPRGKSPSQVAGRWAKPPCTIQPHSSFHMTDSKWHKEKNCPAKLIPNCWWWANKNSCCFKPLNFGVICYAAINSWYTGDKWFYSPLFCGNSGDFFQRSEAIFNASENDEFSSIFKEFYLYSPDLLQSNGDLVTLTCYINFSQNCLGSPQGHFW